METSVEVNFMQVANMLHFLKHSTRKELQNAIDTVKSMTTDMRLHADDRRIAKNVLALLRKEMKEYA